MWLKPELRWKFLYLDGNTDVEIDQSQKLIKNEIG